MRAIVNRLVPASLAMIALLLVSSCTSNTEPDDQRGLELEDAILTDAGLRHQLDAIVEVAPEALAAVRRLELECLSATGFDVDVEVQVASRAMVPNLAGIYGLFASVESARSLGYDTSIVGEDTLGEFRSELDPDQAAVFDAARFGAEDEVVRYEFPVGGYAETTTGGCFGRAIADVFGSATRYLMLSTAPTILSAVSDLESSGVPPGAATYGECMAGAGFSATTLAETQQLAVKRFGSSRPSGSDPTPEEALLAATDALCQERAEFREFFDEVFLRTAAEWLDGNRGWITEVSDVAQFARERSAVVLT